MIRAVLWDVDGTLLDFEAAERAAIFKGFADFGIGTCTEEMLNDYSKINRRYWEALERGELTKKEVLVGRFREFFAKYSLPVDVAEPFNAAYQSNLGETVVFLDGSDRIIPDLKGNVLQYVVTNGTVEAQEKKLKKSGLGAYMDGVFISDRIGSEKPSEGFFVPVFEELTRALGEWKKEEILIVGDSLTSDMQGGINTGIRTCWYDPKRLGDTKGRTLDYVISDLKEVVEILFS